MWGNLSEETGFRGGRKVHGLESFKGDRSIPEMELIFFYGLLLDLSKKWEGIQAV